MISHMVGENFLPYKNLTLSLKPGQLNVVIGKSASDYSDSNGSGKTTLLKLPLWVLYGKYPGMESADSMVNVDVGKNCKGELHFTDRRGVHCVVQRFRKHNEHKNNLYFWEGDQARTGDTKIVQAAIEASIGLSYDVFVSTLVFTGEKENEFASGTDKEQKQILNALMPMDFSAAYAKASEEHASAVAAQEHASARATAARQHVAELEPRIKAEEENVKAWQHNHETQLTELTTKLTGLQHEEARCRAIHENALKVSDQWKQEFDKRIAAANETLPGLKALQEQRQEMVESVHARERLDQSLTHAQAAADSFTERVKLESAQWQEKLAALDQEQSLCPTCGQTMGQAEKERVRRELQQQEHEGNNKNQMEVLRLEQAVTDLQSQIAALGPNPDTTVIDDQLTALEQKRTKLGEAMSEGNNKWKEATQHAEQCHNALTQQTAAISGVEGSLEVAMKQTQNPHSEAVMQLLAACNEAEHAVADNEQAADAAGKDAQYWEPVKTMFSGGKGGLHHFIFEQVLPEMTAMAQMFLNFFSANTLRVEFKSHRKKGKKTIEGFFVDAERGGVKGYGNLSRGEQRRVNVAISLTLYLMAAKHVFNPGLLFLDEVADSLDQTGKQAIIELLQHFCSHYGTSVLLLTNERELVASVPTGYECVQDGGISSLRMFTES